MATGILPREFDEDQTTANRMTVFFLFFLRRYGHGKFTSVNLILKKSVKIPVANQLI